jgi:hypothetical protein
MARPLNKMKEGGGFYTRRPDIEACIDEVLTQSLDTILRRAAIRNIRDPEYMPMECLLHMMREARLKGDKYAEGKLYIPFMARCEARLRRAILDGGRADAAGIREEIMQDFNLLFARVGTNHDATALDYYEVNFNHAFLTLRFKRLRKEDNRRKVLVDIAQEKDEDGKPLDDESVLAKLSQAVHKPTQQDNYVYLTQIGKFLATLSPEDRETVRLVLIERYTIESDDPDEVTAAKLLGVGRRAINKRLAKVASLLKKFQQES